MTETPAVDIDSLFRERGIPLTHQRRAIYQALASTRAHPGAEDIHRRLKRSHPSLSLATVYKTLHTLQLLGLASLVNATHAEARYDAITSTHHHAICVDCGRIDDLFDRKLDRLKAPRSRGFRTLNHSVHFLGRCSSCARKKGRSSQTHAAREGR